MSKYLKSYSLISRSYTAPKNSIDTAANTSDRNVEDSAAKKNQIRVDGYTERDLILFDQLTQHQQHNTPISASTPTASAAQQEYTTADIDNFNNLMNSIHPSSTT